LLFATQRVLRDLSGVLQTLGVASFKSWVRWRARPLRVMFFDLMVIVVPQICTPFK
jgi:hypothetical protein